MENIKDILKKEDARVEFGSFTEAKSFLEEMEALDEYVGLKLNTCQLSVNEDGNMVLTGKDENGNEVEIVLWDFALKSIAKRSGCDASGNSLLTREELAQATNIYLPKHNEKKTCVARVRGEKMMGLGSQQYEAISQSGLVEAVEKWLNDRHPGAYSFVDGDYTHQMTHVGYKVTDAISSTYKAAWRTAGLPENLLNQSNILVDVYTDDTAECSAKAIVRMDVGGSKFLIGNPVSVEHRNGHGGLELFEKELGKLDITIQDEMTSLSNLMSVTLIHPEEAAIMALKKAKIDKLSKKACKELVDDMIFASGESAYIVYLYLHGILDTFNGSRLNEERKLRVVTALRTLLKEDWSKMDVPSATL